MHVLWIMLVKTRGIKYFNVETWMLFSPIKISDYQPALTSNLMELEHSSNEDEFSRWSPA